MAEHSSPALPATVPDTASTPARDRVASDPIGLGLNDMMRIMDVATALRKDRELVEEQLNLDELKARLRERLAAGAAITGEKVTPEEIDAAVDRYFDTLYAYRDPPWSVSTVLALLYVERRRILTALGMAGVVVAVSWWLFVSSSGPFSGPGRLRRQLDAAETRIADARTAILATSPETSARTRSDGLALRATQLEARGDMRDLQATAAELEALAARLAATYTVEIVHERGKKSGIDRFYTDESGTRASGFYVIVQAIGPDGKAVPQVVRNRETNKEETVTTWAEQVREVYDRLVADKKADGVLDEFVFARKDRGRLDEDVVLAGEDGQPLKRMAQIAQW